MIRKANISIPTPCHENWDNMTVVEKGRFCGSCQKEVFDFTKSTDREVLEKLSVGSNHCGRFLNTQLSRELTVPKEKSSIWIAAATGILAFLNPGNSNTYAQGKALIIKTDTKQNPEELQPTSKEHIFQGTVLDSLDALPLPGANVLIKGHDTGVVTDIDGNFTIKAKENDILIVSFIGMIPKEIIARLDVKLKIILEPYSPALFESLTATVGGISIRKRTFSGRVIHSVKNLFTKKENRTSNKYK